MRAVREQAWSCTHVTCLLEATVAMTMLLIYLYSIKGYIYSVRVKLNLPLGPENTKLRVELKWYNQNKTNIEYRHKQ